MRKRGKNNVERGRPHMAVRCMRIACRVAKATNTHSEYVILIAFPLQRWLHESASVSRYTYTDWRVSVSSLSHYFPWYGSVWCD